jgi:hypothetical protein
MSHRNKAKKRNKTFRRFAMQAMDGARMFVKKANQSAMNVPR